MHADDAPPQLSGLTFLEEMLISRILPSMYICRLKGGGQVGYRNHCIAFPQEVQQVVDQLPRAPQDTGVLTFRKHGRNNTHKDFKVRRQVVLEALLYLKDNCPPYADINIDMNRINTMPVDGFLDGLLEVTEKDGEDGAADTVDETREVEQGDTVVTGVTSAADGQTECAKVRNALEWPQRAERPASEYGTVNFWTMCYPTLFPKGGADISNPEKVGSLEPVTLAEWHKYLMEWDDGRFAKHTRWRYHISNMVQRRRARVTGRVFVNHAEGEADMTVDSLKELLNSGDQNVCKRLFHFGSQLRGTPQWKRARRGELLDMIDDRGLPHFFVTWSSADVQWDALQRILNEAEGAPHPQNIEDNHRNRRVNDNPAIVDEYFVRRLESFVDTIVKDGWKSKDHWIIFEWQGRGSIHAHGVVWLEDGVCPVADVEAVVKDTTNAEGRQQLLDFYDQFCSAWNPLGFSREQLSQMLEAPDDCPELANPTIALPPDVQHPCRTTLSPEDDVDSHLSVLCNFCNRHKNCSVKTCLKKKKGKLVCNAGVPWKLRATSEFTDEGRKPGDFVYAPARNDPVMNSYPIKNMAYQHWRANMDIKPVLSKHAMVQYLTKYCTKHEPVSETLKELTQKVERINPEARSYDVFSKALVGTVGERDVSAQEVCHHALGLPGVICSASFQIASIGDSREWDCNEAQLKRSPWETYLERPDTEGLQGLSFFEFTRTWNYYNGQYHKRRKPVVPRIFPRPRVSNKADEQYEDWCRHQLRLHKPCSDDDDVLDGAETYHASLEMFLQANENAPQALRDRFQELQTAVEQAADDSDDGSSSSSSESGDSDAEQPAADAYMEAGQEGIEYEGAQEMDSFDHMQCWNQLKEEHQCSDAKLMDCEEFIKTEKEDFDLPEMDYDDADPTRLNEGQKVAFDELQRTLEAAMQPAPPPAEEPQPKQRAGKRRAKQRGRPPRAAADAGGPSRMLISGTAGTGKSFIIKCLIKHAREQYGVEDAHRAVRLAAPTGTAFNVGGVTLHSLLRLPVPLPKHLPALTGEALINILEKLNGLKMLVVDEMSMVG